MPRNAARSHCALSQVKWALRVVMLITPKLVVSRPWDPLRPQYKLKNSAAAQTASCSSEIHKCHSLFLVEILLTTHLLDLLLASALKLRLGHGLGLELSRS